MTNHQTGTRVDEIAGGIYRICTPLDVIPGGFTSNSYLIDDEEPLLFHTGYRKLFSVTVEAIQTVLPVQSLRWIGGSHLTSLDEFATGGARGLRDGEELAIGNHRLQWVYTPHLPHGWDCGVLYDQSTATLLCGDLFTQPGATPSPVTESEILSASEGMRGMMDYYAHATGTSPILERLASLRPSMLACQHGSAYRGDGAALLRELAGRIESGSASASAGAAR